MFLSIKKLEEKLLSLSTSDDVVVADRNEKKEYKKILSPDEVKKEISIISRILINGYCGWPFHSKLTKWTVLMKLNKLFNIDNPMTAEDFFTHIGSVLNKIPDNHLEVQLLDKGVGRNKRKSANVGKNIAEEPYYKIKRQNDIAIIAMPRMDGECIKNPEKFLEQARFAIDGAAAVIIDLRGNGGGNSITSDRLAEYLYGATTWPALRIYGRGTKEWAIMKTFHGENFSLAKLTEDPWINFDYRGKKYPKFSGVKKPIYILTDSGTGSGSEMFLARMSHHPFAKRVGDNSKGCEVYGNQSICRMPYSGIILYAGTSYRELEVGNIELKGYAPDIRVPHGMDALDFILKTNIISRKILQMTERKTK
jgi:C-terminal processing protease CtpA/Prc